MNDFEGAWQLTEYGSSNGELNLINGEYRFPDAESWLLGSPALEGSVTSCSGLRLTIEDSHFNEIAFEFSELMFDREGIQVNEYEPMSGNVLTIKNIGFLIPDRVPEYALPPVNDKIAARYGDGDTVVCDTLRRIENDLLRQVSVITDELYLDRMVLVYQPSG